MISQLFLYDPLYASSHVLESDYPWSGLQDENSPTIAEFKCRDNLIDYIGRNYMILSTFFANTCFQKYVPFVNRSDLECYFENGYNPNFS